MTRGTDYITSFLVEEMQTIIDLSYKKEWDVFVYISSDYSKTPFLV